MIPTNHCKPQRTKGLQLAAKGCAVMRTDSGMLQSDCRYGLHMTDSPRQTAENHYYAALDLLADGDREGARSEYEKSVAADPTFTEAMHGHAKVLVDLERLDEAIIVAKRIAELDPEDVLAHTSLSVIYQKKGMIEEAEAEGAKARVLGWKQQLKKGGS
jgi:Flp pilus assembly protein TadD